jgi:hydroxyacylglutathione hydrolase
MLNRRELPLTCVLVSLAIAASMQTAFAADGPAGSGGGPAAGGRGRGGAAQSPMHRALLTGVIRLTPGTSVNMYLVVGKEKALLIDTGNPGNITLDDIKALTQLPLLVVNTHAHPDHSGCNSAFGKVYIHEADVEAGKRYSGNAELIPIEDGYVFDLGGKKLEVIAVPGHTPGSICLLDAQEKLLFGGDTANGETWMHISSVPLETYKKSMEHLLTRKEQYDLLLPGHGDARPISYITELIACADDILTGKVEPAKQPAQPAARGNPLQGGSLHKHGTAAIRYNPNNLREKTN